MPGAISRFDRWIRSWSVTFAEDEADGPKLLLGHTDLTSSALGCLARHPFSFRKSLGCKWEPVLVLGMQGGEHHGLGSPWRSVVEYYGRSVTAVGVPIWIQLGPTHVTFEHPGIHSVCPYTDACWSLPVTMHTPSRGRLLAESAHRPEHPTTNYPLTHSCDNSAEQADSSPLKP